MKVLFAGFEGLNNCSKLVLDRLKDCDKLYLKNDKDKSTQQIINALLKNNYDICIILGQKPGIKNKISIEFIANNNDIKLKTNFDVEKLTSIFDLHYLRYYFSEGAGTSFCNNIYFQTLSYIIKNNLKTKTIFIHIPFKKYFEDIEKFCKALQEING